MVQQPERGGGGGVGGWCSLRPTHSTLRKKYFVCICPGSTHTHPCTDTHVKTQTKHALNRGTVHTPIPRRRRTLAKRKEIKRDRIQASAVRPEEILLLLPGLSAAVRLDAVPPHQPSSSPSLPLARPHLSTRAIEKKTKKNAVPRPTESKYWTHSCS